MYNLQLNQNSSVVKIKATSDAEMEIFFCTLCSLRFASEAIFKIHSKILHKYDEDNSMEIKKHMARLMVVSLVCHGEEQFKCLICNSGFAKNEHLIRHNSLAHEPNSSYPEESTLFQTVHETERPFECSICNVRFKLKSGMNFHLSSVHSGIRFQCPKCEASFKQKAFLKRHDTTFHEGKKLFECHICQKKLSSKQSVDDHISSVHEGKKPHHCQICNSSFGMKDS